MANTLTLGNKENNTNNTNQGHTGQYVGSVGLNPNTQQNSNSVLVGGSGNGAGANNIDDNGNTNTQQVIYVNDKDKSFGELVSGDNIKNVTSIAEGTNFIFGFGDEKKKDITAEDNNPSNRTSYSPDGSLTKSSYRKWVSKYGANGPLKVSDSGIIEIIKDDNRATNVYEYIKTLPDFKEGAELIEMFFYGAHGIPATTVIEDNKIEGRAWDVVLYD